VRHRRVGIGLAAAANIDIIVVKHRYQKHDLGWHASLTLGKDDSHVLAELHFLSADASSLSDACTMFIIFMRRAADVCED